MSNEEAIEIIKQDIPCEHDTDLIEALDVAIKALEQEPTEKPMCDRNICISNEYNGIGCDECIVNKVGHKPCRVKNELNVELNELKPCDDAINRRFEKIVVEYPTICTYPEYQGKPYFSIQYEENGEHIVGYGTYKPEVLTRYIKEYFMPSVTQKSGKWIDYSDEGYVECPFCGHATNCEDDIDELHYCFYCGAKMEGEE